VSLLAVSLLPRARLAVSQLSRALLPVSLLSLLALPVAGFAVPELLAMPRRLPGRGLVVPWRLSVRGLVVPWRLPVPGLVLPLLAVAWLALVRLALPWLALAGLLVVRLAGRMRLRHGTFVRREERTGRPVEGRLVTHPCEATLAA
jgi:hypothetical protein